MQELWITKLLGRTEELMGDLRTAGGLLELMRQPGIGPGTALSLAEHFNSLEALVAASPAERRAVAGSRGANLDVGALIPTRLADATTGVIGYFDDEFPTRLRGIPSPPAVLWVRGILPDASTPAIAVVGTREPTAWGIRIAERSVDALKGTNAVVVSGLARGVDGVAHRRALEVGLRTIAILGSGVDSPTPREHLRLAEDILQAGGALVSEVPPGTKPSAQTLVSRNRLQSGMADAVVVAQCGLGSGTLHTARFCLLQKRKLIVPEPTGRFTEEVQSSGNLALVHGNDPATIKASNTEAKRLSARARLADSAPTDSESLVAAVQEATSGLDGHTAQADSTASQMRLE